MIARLLSPFFTQPTPKELRQASLLNAERSLVEMESQAAYSRKMVEYYKENVARLKDQLGYDTPTNHHG